MQYIRLNEQDKDWQPVISKFVSEAFSNDFLDYKVRYEFGEGHKTFQLSEKAMQAGYTNIKDLFNRWYQAKKDE